MCIRDSRDALNAHLYERKRERSAKTIHNYLNIAETHLADLMDKPMTWLGANQHLIEALHDRVTRRGWDRTKKAGRGRRATCGPAPYSANGAVRLFRAVYKHARVKKSHLKLPEFQPIELNPEHAKDCLLYTSVLPCLGEHLGVLHGRFVANRAVRLQRVALHHV